MRSKQNVSSSKLHQEIPCNLDFCREIPDIRPFIDHSVRGLCRKPYYGHPKGCPNWNSRETCPPQAPYFEKLIDITEAVFCVFNRFDIGAHTKRMRDRHPEWSDRQLLCCLYWQGTARKALRKKVSTFVEISGECRVLYCPEACGVNITLLMKSLGHLLEWPPQKHAYQIALAGKPVIET